MKKFVGDLVPLLLICALVTYFAVVPYFGIRNQLHIERDQLIYQCKVDQILQQFLNAASQNRFETAELAKKGKLPSQVIHINIKAVKKYKQLKRRLDTLPSPSHPGCPPIHFRR